MSVLGGIMVALQNGDREVPSSNPTQDKFLTNVNPALKISGGTEPHRDRINNHNNKNNNNNKKKNK